MYTSEKGGTEGLVGRERQKEVGMTGDEDRRLRRRRVVRDSHSVLFLSLPKFYSAFQGGVTGRVTRSASGPYGGGVPEPYLTRETDLISRGFIDVLSK